MRGVSLLIILAFPQWADDPYRGLLDQARGEPVEIFADLAFRVLERLAPKDRAAVLEEIFLRAGQAREPLPLQDALGRDGARAAAFELGLDALSLRCRAVRELLKLNPRRARELFAQLPPRMAAPGDCREPFVPDSSIYVRTLAALGGPDLLQNAERALRLPANSSELAEAVRTLPPLARTDEEKAAMTAALSSALSLTDSDYGFTVGGVADAVLRAPPQEAVLSALRGYLVRHLAAVRCAGWNAKEAAQFNAAVAGVSGVSPIAEQETVPVKVEAAAPPQPSPGQELLREVQALGRVRRGESLWQVRLTAEWTARARETLRRVERWKGAQGQDAADVFGQRCRLYAAIADAAPAGEIQTAAVEGWIAALEDVEVLRQTPAWWRVEVGRLLTHQESLPKAAIESLREKLGETREGLSFAPLTGRVFLERLAASRLNALALYGRAFLLSRE